MSELNLIESLEQTLLGSEREQFLTLKESLGELALQALTELEDWLNVVDRSVLDDDLDCQETIERLTRLRSAATGQIPQGQNGSKLTAFSFPKFN